MAEAISFFLYYHSFFAYLYPPLTYNEIGDRVQTLNTFVPITGEIVDMYKNLVTIADDDAETVDQLLSFHADDLEVIS